MATAIRTLAAGQLSKPGKPFQAMNPALTTLSVSTARNTGRRWYSVVMRIIT